MKGLDEEEIVARWLDFERKILLYAVREDKRSVKSIVTRFNSMEEENAGYYNIITILYANLFWHIYTISDRTTAYVLQLVTAMLQPRGKVKASFFSVFEVRYTI